MKAWILIVGDDPVLLHTRAELLRDWHISTATSWIAEEVMREREYNLLIFSQTIPERSARTLIAQALTVQPDARILVIRSGEDRRLGSPTYQVDLNNPGGFRSAVATILETCPAASMAT